MDQEEKRRPAGRAIDRFRRRYNVSTSSGGAAPAAPAESPDATSDQAVRAELEKRNSPTKGGNGGALLALSLIAFVGISALGASAESIAILVGVLLLHEFGHYIGMRAFGYRNTKMFFIPLLGAAVSGEHLNAPGYKRAAVSLLGPVPGIALGIALGSSRWAIEYPFVDQVAYALIGLNALNLLPLFPLDGGHFMYEVLFCRNRHLERVFKIITGALIALMGYALDWWVLTGVGVLVVFSSRHSFKVASLAPRVIDDIGRPESADVLALDDERFGALVDRVRSEFPEMKTSSTLASIVRQVWDRLFASPPGLGLTLLLMALYFGVWAGVVYPGAGLLSQATQERQSRDAELDQPLTDASESFTQGRYAEAESRLIELVQRLRGKDDYRLAGALLLLGHTYHARGDYDQALPVLSEAAELFRYLGEHDGVAAALMARAYSLNRLGRLKDADKVAGHVIGSRLSPTMSYASVLLRARLTMRSGYAERALGDLEEAWARPETTAETRAALAGTEHLLIGDLSAAVGQSAKALEHYDLVVKAARKADGPRHPRVAKLLIDVASVLADEQRYDEAQRLCDEALPILRELVGDKHPAMAQCLTVQSIVARAQGRFLDAQTHAQLAVDLMRASLSKAHPDTVWPYHALAMAVHAQGRSEEAYGYLRWATQVLNEAEMTYHPRRAEIAGDLAAICSELGYDEEAKVVFGSALFEFAWRSRYKWRQCAHVHEEYAKYLSSRGFTREAERHLKRAEEIRERKQVAKGAR